MSFRITLALGFAIGYVFGTKAGRQRYEQIARAARKLKDSPSVQGAAGMLQAQADTALDLVRSKLGNEAPARADSHAGHLNGQTLTP